MAIGRLNRRFADQIANILYHCARNRLHMKLVVISNERNIPGEAATVNDLFREGLDLFHLRKPAFGRPEYAGLLSLIDKRFHPRVVIHGSYELYTELNLGGIHLNSSSRENPKIWNTIAAIPPAAVSTSFHSWEEILNSDFHYGSVFISPVFDSISKPGYKGAIDIAAITEVKNSLASGQKYCPEIIGLGGVDRNGIPVLKQHGFDGAAILGAIWNAQDPVAAYKEIQAATKQAG